jgi:hypothetical protein
VRDAAVELVVRTIPSHWMRFPVAESAHGLCCVRATPTAKGSGIMQQGTELVPDGLLNRLGHLWRACIATALQSLLQGGTCIPTPGAVLDMALHPGTDVSADLPLEMAGEEHKDVRARS